MFKKAKGDFYKMLDLRYNAHNKEVKDNPKQVEFQKGWLNRVERITQGRYGFCKRLHTFGRNEG